MQRRQSLVGTVIYSGKREEDVHKLTQEEILADLAANGFTLERLERILANSESNDEYFRAHQWELFERYPDKHLLIHSGGIVEAFDHISEVCRRRDELNQDGPEGAISRSTFQPPDGVWIL